MHIAIVDYLVTRNNPAGSCHLRIVEGLCETHTFTVFSSHFENPRPNRIRWVRVPILLRPLCLQFIVFQLAATLAYVWRYLLGDRYDLVQFVESTFWFGDVSYFHFCHKAYLESQWSKADNAGLARLFRYWNHKLHAWTELRCLQRVKVAVVPSQGLASDLERGHPGIEQNVVVVPNAVSGDRMIPPASFDRSAFRSSLGVSDGDTLLAFIALGNFEHKGLPMLVEALRSTDAAVRLCVVGGESDMVRAWLRKAEAAQLSGRLVFAGRQIDVRPYLWASDGFILPSLYETFSLVALEAAAAGLPLLTTKLHGVEDYLRHGENGFVFDRTPHAIGEAIASLQRMTPAERRAMGLRARASVLRYSPAAFVNGWRDIYTGLSLQICQRQGNAKFRRGGVHV